MRPFTVAFTFQVTPKNPVIRSATRWNDKICDGQIASDDDGKPLVSALFEGPAFDMARREAQESAANLRRMGEFEPARLSAETMEYTTLPQVLEKLEKRFKKA